jgi:hypothetical protein
MSATVLAGVIACGLAVVLHETRGDERVSPERAAATAIAADFCVILQPALFGAPGERLISARRDAAARVRSVDTIRDGQSTNAVVPFAPNGTDLTRATPLESRHDLAAARRYVSEEPHSRPTGEGTAEGGTR